VGIIRTSDRQFFKRCRVLWDYTSKIRQNFEPIQRIEALDFGTAMHAGLQAYYNPETWGDTLTMQANARQGFLDSIHDIQTKVRIGPLEFEERFEELRKLGLGMLEYYFLWAPSRDTFTPVYVEIEFEVPLEARYLATEIDVYQGRIDLIVEDEYGYWIVDHKTAAQFGDTEWLALDDQCSSYAWAVQKKLGLKVRGVIYNELRKKVPHPPAVLRSGELSRNKQQDTTYETYLAAIKAGGYRTKGYAEILAYLKNNPKQFVRRTRLNYTPQMLDLVEQRISSESYEMLHNPLIYPTPSRFNCQGCSFFAPCLARHEGRDEQLILDELYEKRRPA